MWKTLVSGLWFTKSTFVVQRSSKAGHCCHFVLFMCKGMGKDLCMFPCLFWYFIRFFSPLSPCPKSLAGFKGHFLFAEFLLTLVGVLCKHLGLQYSPACPPHHPPFFFLSASQLNKHNYLCALWIWPVLMRVGFLKGGLPFWHIYCCKSSISKSGSKNVVFLSLLVEAA